MPFFSFLDRILNYEFTIADIFKVHVVAYGFYSTWWSTSWYRITRTRHLQWNTNISESKCTVFKIKLSDYDKYFQLWDVMLFWCYTKNLNFFWEVLVNRKYTILCWLVQIPISVCSVWRLIAPIQPLFSKPWRKFHAAPRPKEAGMW